MSLDTLVGGHANAGFDAPLALLSACHERISKQCATLQRLSAHLTTHGADDAARQAAAGVIRYFETAGHQHHQDEEEDLFPALFEAMAGSDAVCLRDMRERVVHEHHELDAAWQVLHAQLVRVEMGDAAALDTRSMEDFVQRHRRHIDFEEAELLPLATRLLSDEQLQIIGSAMRARRSR